MLTGRFRYPSDGNTPVGLQPLPSITEVASSIGYAQYLPSYREVQAGEGLLTSTDSPRPQFLACHHLPQVTGQHPSPPVKAEIVHPHYVSHGALCHRTASLYKGQLCLLQLQLLDRSFARIDPGDLYPLIHRFPAARSRWETVSRFQAITILPVSRCTSTIQATPT